MRGILRNRIQVNGIFHEAGTEIEVTQAMVDSGYVEKVTKEDAKKVEQKKAPVPDNKKMETKDNK